MKVIFTIIRQTLREALRSRVFHVLFVLTAMAAVLLPLTVEGDGTPSAAVQAVLTYSLQAVTVLLTLAAVWIGCTNFSRDIETHRIHMLLTKPVHPWKLWLGKWLAVVIMNSVVLAASAILIYALVQHRLASDEFSEEKVEEARTEVLVGRKVYEPERSEYLRQAERKYQRMVEEGTLDPEHSPERVRRELLRRMRGQASEVRPNGVKRWRFESVTPAKGKPLFFRYRLFVAETDRAEQRETAGVWRFFNPASGEEGPEGYMPKRSRGGMFNQIRVAPGLVGEDGVFAVEYLNRDPQGEIVIFQQADGPELMTPALGFLSNYIRGIGVIFLRLSFFAALGCALGAVFSGPVAVFTAFSYVFFSIIIDATMGETGQVAAAIPPGHNLFTYGMVVIMDKVIISLREFDIPNLLSSGRLVGWDMIANAAFFQFIFRGAPLAVLAVLIFSRREMGKVLRK